MEVFINREELISKLKHNREEHREIFLDALEGYKKKVIKAFEEKIDRVRNGELVDLYVRLVQPVDKTRDYDSVIAMFEMTNMQDVALNEHEFRRYVMDDWEWKEEFRVSNSAYTKKI